MDFLIMNRDTVVAEYIPPLTEEIILKVINIYNIEFIYQAIIIKFVSRRILI